MTDPEALLAAERDRVLARLAALDRAFDAIVEAAEGANLDDEHDPEGATVAFERQQVAALRTQARERLAALAEALDRARAGGWDVCAVCEGPIGAERLAARPSTTTCVACAT